MVACFECCVLSGRGLGDELITCPEESHRLWCVIVCDLKTSRMRKALPALGRSATETNNTIQNKPSRTKENGLRCHGNKNSMFLTKKTAMKGCRVETFVSILHGCTEMHGFWPVKKLL